MEQKGKLEVIAFKNFTEHKDLVYVVDFLNKSLKDKGIMFGITKDKEKSEMTINIYEFE
ncbi:MAG: YpmA family protein [Syntrophomonadaceae bacterium]|nr:YpmA family protein [Syntrophomonadaceae bacterium]